MSTAAPNTADDPRWLEFNRAGFECSCGQRHVGLFPINMLVPVGWTGGRDYAPDDALDLTGNFLSENFCVWQGQYYAMRMRLPLQIQGAAPAAFMYTVWAGVSRADMETYVAARKDGALCNTTQFSARLVNRIAGYPETSNLLGIAFQQEDGGPPLLLLAGPQPGANPGHPLIGEQRNGIGLDRALELFAAYGHDMQTNPSTRSH